MEAISIESLDGIKEDGLSLALGCVGSGPGDTRVARKLSYRDVIVTASLAAHAWSDLGGEQELAEGTGGSRFCNSCNS
jgi:hypothetical protein